MSNEIVLFTPTLAGGGGVERNTVNLANGMATERDVSILTPKGEARGPLTDNIKTGIEVEELSLPLVPGIGVLGTIPSLTQYLRRKQPATIISAMRHANLALQIARQGYKGHTRFIFTFHNNANQLISEPDLLNRLRIKNIFRVLGALHRPDDIWVGVSNGVCDSVANVTGISRNQIETIYNPVVTEELLRGEFERPDHPWYDKGETTPVILGAKPQPQKNLSLLIDAVAEMDRDARVVIVGQGSETEQLEQRAEQRGIRSQVDILGLVNEIYPYILHSDVFALTSNWEGLPTILIEALACGTQVVATDCPSGPAEILNDGEIGVLVEMGNVGAVARGLETVIEDPVSESRLIERARDFSSHSASRQYLKLVK